jgi:hypothetical protein
MANERTLLYMLYIHLSATWAHLPEQPGNLAMSRTASTIQIFGGYLMALSLGLMAAPNVLLPLFGMPPTSEVWIRVAGLVVFNEGVCYWFAAKSNAVPFFRASSYVRCLAPIVFGAFVLAGLAHPMLVGFGLVDLAAGVWTILTLRAEMRALAAA